MLPLPATPAPLATAAFTAPPAAPLVADVSAILTGQYYFVIVGSNSIQLVACVFFYRLCIITVVLFLFI